MSLRDEMLKYEQITGESAEHVPIMKLGAFLDGYEMGLKALEQQPCEDCISRKAVINTIFYNSDNNCDVVLCTDLMDRIKDLPSVTPKTEWIPVSERLPEEFVCDDGYVEPSDYVLVWGDHGNYGVSRYWGNRRTKSESPNTYKDWMDLDWVVQKPIAWMPLPEPYKAESEEKDD